MTMGELAIAEPIGSIGDNALISAYLEGKEEAFIRAYRNADRYRGQ